MIKIYEFQQRFIIHSKKFPKEEEDKSSSRVVKRKFQKNKNYSKNFLILILS